MTPLDTLAYRSPLRSRSPEGKLAYSLLTLLGCVLGANPLCSLPVLALNGYLTVRRGGVRLRCWLGYMALPAVFLLVSGGTLVLNWSPVPMDLFALRLGRGYLTAGRAGLLYSCNLTLTALAAVSCLCFLAMTTPVPEQLQALKRLHCPALLLELMLLIYRYSFLLLETARAIRTAQKSRLGNRNRKTELRAFGSLGSALFVRSVQRARAQFEAMESRCYDGTIRVLGSSRPPEQKERLLLAGWVILLAAAGLGGRALWSGM